MNIWYISIGGINMTLTLRINARNDLHLPAKALRALNLGEDRILKAEIKDNEIVLIPVDLEPRYSKRELEAWDRLHEEQKKKGFIPLNTEEDIDKLFKKSRKH